MCSLAVGEHAEVVAAAFVCPDAACGCAQVLTHGFVHTPIRVAGRVRVAGAAASVGVGERDGAWGENTLRNLMAMLTYCQMQTAGGRRVQLALGQSYVRLQLVLP